MKISPEAAQEALERKLARATKTIAELSNVKDLQEFALRLQRFPELSELIPAVQERINEVIAQNEIDRNERLLPEPLAHDHEFAPLRQYWIDAAAHIGSIGTRSLQMVRRRGYRDAMLEQLKNVEDIGENRFHILREKEAVHLSAEYLMRKFYSDRLNDEQKTRIDEVLSNAGVDLKNM